jgi:hypothetical protein
MALTNGTHTEEGKEEKEDSKMRRKISRKRIGRT